MPKLKQPVKLEKMCILTMARMLRRLVDMDRLRDMVRLRDMDHPEDSEDTNPIAHLPRPAVQELITELGALFYPMPKHIMRIVLCSRLRMNHLDLSSIVTEEPAEILRMLHPMGNNLRTLQLLHSRSSHMLMQFDYYAGTEEEDENVYSTLLCTTRTDMLKLIGSLVNVTHLELNEFGFDDALDAVGESCPQLKVLQTSCEHVTDRGWERLCVDPVNGRPRCQKLQKIVIPNCTYSQCFTSEGLLFVLRHLPCLVELENCEVAELLVRAHKTDFETTQMTYPLRHLTYRTHKRDPSESPLLAADIVLRTCPFLTTLKLIQPTDETLPMFGRLQNLVDVTIIAHPEVVSFDGGVLPFLRQAGSNLTKFSLQNLGQVDLGAIDYCCPKLTHLDCYIRDGVVDGELKNAVSFKNLQKLSFTVNRYFGFNSQSAVCLKMLMCYCLDLKYLHLCNCNHLTDQVLMYILRVNPLKCLEYLEFVDIEALSINVFRMLIDCESELREIKMDLGLFDSTENYGILKRELCEQYRGCNLDLVFNNVNIGNFDRFYDIP